MTSASPHAGAASTQVPDAAGRFGAFGGRYVPETLTRALDELTAEYEQGPAGPAFPGRAGRPVPALRRPAVAALFRPAADRGVRRGADLAQARGPEPHRRPQDQQHARPGAAHAAHGQAAGDRRDRGRAARRGHRDGLCPFWPRLRRLHGRGGHPPPGAERLQHEAAGRRGAAGQQRLADAPRRHQRGPARLDGQRRDDALHHRLGGRAAPVPADRPRFPVGHRPRGPRAIARPDRPAARPGRGLRRRRQQRGRHVLSVHRRRRASSCSASRPAAAARSRAITPRRCRTARPACCTAASAT